MLKKYLFILLFAFSILPPTQAMQEPERPWPEMTYSDKTGAKCRLVSLREVTEKTFVPFATTLFSTQGVYELYENGIAWDEARAQRLWGRVSPRTEEWFKGINTFVPWTVIQVCETETFIGILGAHFHTNEKINEYKSVEICYALHPEYRGKGILSTGFRTFAQAFAPQLQGLGDQFDRILAPISPINFPSLKFVFSLGFKVGEDSRNQPYVSSFFPENYISEENKPRFLGYAVEVVKKLQSTSEMVEPNPNSFEMPIDEQDWAKLLALRIVAIMPKDAFFEKFLEK